MSLHLVQNYSIVSSLRLVVLAGLSAVSGLSVSSCWSPSLRPVVLLVSLSCLWSRRLSGLSVSSRRSPSLALNSRFLWSLISFLLAFVVLESYYILISSLCGNSAHEHGEQQESLCLHLYSSAGVTHSLRILQVETGKLILSGLAGSEQIEKTGKQLCDNSLFAMTIMLPLITRFNMNMHECASLFVFVLYILTDFDSPNWKSTYSLIREPGEVVKIKYTDVPLLYYTEILSMPDTFLGFHYRVILESESGSFGYGHLMIEIQLSYRVTRLSGMSGDFSTTLHDTRGNLPRMK
ncbi:hypothetical protein Syun_029376 [Stephania yunnanensis]|uniref:Uncharacterized protein n=1 Tax=Stephania yunnanensis TaxID=152371 RepID=A0AAP0HJE2_9MAGN